MLNELYQVSQNLERVGIDSPSRDSRISPMGKNRELLIVRLNTAAEPSDVEFVSGAVAAHLFRVEHGSAGSSFPGFNLPTPLLDLIQAYIDLKPILQRLCKLQKKGDSSTQQIYGALTELARLSHPRQFTPSQCKQFKRSAVELVQELRGRFCRAEPELENFKRLLYVVGRIEFDMAQFSQNLIDALLCMARTADRETLFLVQGVLFGVLDWKKRNVDFGSVEYWKEKAKQDKPDKNAKQPVYLDVADIDQNHKPVAHQDTSKAINKILVQQSKVEDQLAQSGIDAFGSRGSLQDKYPAPKIAKLGDVKLFSVNTNEISALNRYGLKGSKQFPASTQVVQKMSNVLLYLGDEGRGEGVTWKSVPGNLVNRGRNKNDLLIAYLEKAPDFQEELADLFGGEAPSFSDDDFAARTQPVLQALDAKLETEPNEKVRLLALCSIDKARKQISLHRQFRVQDIVQAAGRWKNGAANTPAVSIWFYDKKGMKFVRKSHFVPHPLDLTSIINRVWSSDPKSGFVFSFQRAITTSDAYDVFFADGPISENKTQLCFSLLLYRMSPVLAYLGGVKASSNWGDLSEPVRWQCRKAISLLGILLHQLEHPKDQFMEDSIYQIGRLLVSCPMN